jgi:hypothetical protein
VAYASSHQIYHPNVDLEGNVCLNILREDWKPVLNLNAVMVGLQYLFLEPNADDPLNKGGNLLYRGGYLLITISRSQRRRRICAEIETSFNTMSRPPSEEAL